MIFHISIVFNVFIALIFLSKLFERKSYYWLILIFPFLVATNVYFFHQMPYDIEMPVLIRGFMYTIIVFFIAFFHSVAIKKFGNKKQ
jgi:hypothetical protein